MGMGGGGNRCLTRCCRRWGEAEAWRPPTWLVTVAVVLVFFMAVSGTCYNVVVKVPRCAGGGGA